MSTSTRWLNFLERVLWTLLQAVSAEGILTGYEHFKGELDPSTHALMLVALTTILAAVKNAATQAFGSPTGATLPKHSAPVPAENVVAEVDTSSPTDIVAGRAADAPTGEPVEQPQRILGKA